MEKTDYMTIGADIEYFVAPPIKEMAIKPPPSMSEEKMKALSHSAMVNYMEHHERARKDAHRRRINKLGMADASKIVPCVGYCPGTKTDPFRSSSWAAGFALQEDNVMLEVNIPFSKNARDFGRAVERVNQIAIKYMAPHGLVPVLNVSEYLFLPKDLTSPQAQNFACDPDFDAYLGGEERTNVPDFKNMRSCGGHIHLGGDFKCPDWVAVLFFEMALYHAYGNDYVCPSNQSRTQWYGRPGTFRPKPYGIEYRTLGNWWSSSRTSAEDVGHTLYRTGNWLIRTPTQMIQAAFRTVKWTLLHNILLMNYPDHNTPKLKSLAVREDRLIFSSSVKAAHMEIE